MRNRFDMQLETLEQLLIKMGELCENAIEKATRAIKDGDIKLAKELIDTDDTIDNMEKTIEQLCLKILLQQQPVAKDLRRISAALKMVTDMERIGDMACDICEIVLSSKDYRPTDIKKIGDMAVAASKMVHDSVAAYVEKNLELARQVMQSDDIVDDLFDEIRNGLANEIKYDSGENGSKILDLIMAAKYLERIADHATNIAEWVEFSITGVHKDHVDVTEGEYDILR